MACPLDNLRDYNVVRDALKEANGDADRLFQDIRDTAVEEEGPKIFKDGCLTGIGIGVVISSIVYGGYTCYKNKKQRKKALETEQELKGELAKTIETSCKTEIEEKATSKSVEDFMNIRKKD